MAHRGAQSVSDESSVARGDAALRKIARRIRDGRAKRIVVITGAGISTSAGIPDFRSPGTGLYNNLAALNLPEPQAVFDVRYFKKRPEPFWILAKDLYPGKYLPTPTHYFLILLHAHNVLHRVYTQNIDTLESLAGLPRSHVIEAHGSFASAHCLSCRRQHSREHVLAAGVREGKVVRCTDKKCGGLVKPDIVFFGDALPDVFHDNALEDMCQADLVLVMGTSLGVQPIASLHNRAGDTVPRVLINRELVGNFQSLRPTRVEARREHSGRSSRSRRRGNDAEVEELTSGLSGVRLSEADAGKGGNEESDVDVDEEEEEARFAARDGYFLGDTDEAVRRLAGMLGWGEELEGAVRAGRAGLRREWGLTEEDEEERGVVKASRADKAGGRAAEPSRAAVGSVKAKGAGPSAQKLAKAPTAAMSSLEDGTPSVPCGASGGTLQRARAAVGMGESDRVSDGPSARSDMVTDRSARGGARTGGGVGASEPTLVRDNDSDSDIGDDEDRASGQSDEEELVPAVQVERMSALLAAQMKRAGVGAKAGGGVGPETRA